MKWLVRGKLCIEVDRHNYNFLYWYQVPKRIMATPNAMIIRAVNKKTGLIKDLKGIGAFEINSHLLSKFWHSLSMGKASKITMNIINSAVPIQDNIAPERTIICKFNQLRKTQRYWY